MGFWKIINIIIWILLILWIIEEFIYDLKDHGFGRAVRNAFLRILILLAYLALNLLWDKITDISRGSWAEGIVDFLSALFD